MATLPERLSRVIWWVKVRLPVWEADPAFIGLDEATVAELAALAEQAAQARIAYTQAKAAARGAGGVYRERARLLRKRTSVAIDRVRGHAAGQADPTGVLVAARLRKRSRPSPTPAPGTPGALATELLQNGWLKCKFPCKNHRSLRGVTYLIERRLGPTGAYEFLTLARGRAFTDKTIPRGTDEATYRITSQTSTKAGKPANFTVRFGAVEKEESVRKAEVAPAA
ncbi:MAG: hypothetical protein ACIAS6_09980 [Phycisphaerales bacterium JB060]